MHFHGVPIFGNFFNQSSFAAYALANEANTVKVSHDAPLELLARIYFESGTIRSYSARPERLLAADEGWHKPA